MGVVGKLRGGQGVVEREDDADSDNFIVDLGSSDSEDSNEADSSDDSAGSDGADAAPVAMPQKRRAAAPTKQRKPAGPVLGKAGDGAGSRQQQVQPQQRSRPAKQQPQRAQPAALARGGQQKSAEALAKPASAEAGAGRARAASKTGAKQQLPMLDVPAADAGRKRPKETRDRQRQDAAASAVEQRQHEPSAGKTSKRKGSLSAVAGATQPGQRQEDQVARPAKKRKSSMPPPSQQQQDQAERPAKKRRSPVPPPSQQQRQQQPRSPTPAAAAAAQALEMSAPPSAGAQAAALREAGRRGSSQAVAGAAEQAGQAGGLAAGTSAGGEDLAATAAGYLLTRLTMPRSREAATMPLRPRLQEAYELLLGALHSTVELGHNNSLLVLGPRGSGKTLMVERALAALEERWNGDARDPTVAVVRLSGLAHAEERAAFREVARRLCEVWGHPFSWSASLTDNMLFLRGMLRRLASADKAAVFVLDEFDLFASRRQKQALLYGLLDALQTSGIRAGVVGLSVRQDVMELLEKRVKSRFSHRKVDLTLPTGAAPYAPPPAEEGQVVQLARDGALDVFKAMLTLPPDFGHREFAARWNASVAAAAADADVRAQLQRLLNVRPSLRQLATVADRALPHAIRAGGAVAAGALRGALQRQLSQSKAVVNSVASLPMMDLMLLVAAHRLERKGRDEWNFEMAFSELLGYMSQGSHVDRYERGAVAKGYDHLLSQGLVAFVDPRNEYRVGARHYAGAYLQVMREEIEEGMAAHWLGSGLQQLREWLKREGGMGTTAAQFL